MKSMRNMKIKKALVLCLAVVMIITAIVPAYAEANSSEAEKILNDAKKEMDGLCDLFEYRCNTLIPEKTHRDQMERVEVEINGETRPLEACADWSSSEYSYRIVPVQPEYTEPIKVGILQSSPYMKIDPNHREGDLDVMTVFYADCPEVNTNLFGTFYKLLKAFKNDCSSKLSWSHLKYKPIIMTNFGDMGALSDIYYGNIDRMNAIYNEKLKSIWNCYVKYCKKHPGEYDPLIKPEDLPEGAEEYNDDFEGYDDDPVDDNPESQKSSGGGTNTYKPLFTGTSENPVSNGRWTLNADGTWSYTTTRKFTGTWGYICNPADNNKPAWFYFDKQGVMLIGWQWIKDSDGITRCYYLNPVPGSTQGVCFLGPGTTPDGWTVDANGAWTVNGVVVTK